MSLASSPLRPSSRRAISLAVSLSCLLTASHVLSSVGKIPPHTIAFPPDSFAPDMVFLPVLPERHFGPGPHTRTVQAEVRVQGRMLQITNTSGRTWQDIRVQVGHPSGAHSPIYRLACLRPFETRQIPLTCRQTSPDMVSASPSPIYVRWLWRADGGRGAWLGYIPSQRFRRD